MYQYVEKSFTKNNRKNFFFNIRKIDNRNKRKNYVIVTSSETNSGVPTQWKSQQALVTL